MQSSVEKVSNTLRRLTVIVPTDQVEAVYQKHLDYFAKNAQIKGFRRGKVPLNYITQRFGSDARQETMKEVVENSLKAALIEKDLRPITTPRIELKSGDPSKPLEYNASFEVMPEMGPIQFKMDSIEKVTAVISDEDIQRVIDQLIKQFTTWTVVDRAAKDTDRVVVDYSTYFDGQIDEQSKSENLPIELGSKTMLPGFEEGLIGVKAGDEKTLNLQLPEAYPVKDKAGKPVEFRVQVKQVFEAVSPELNAEFFVRLGIKSGKEEDLKTQIRNSLEQERDRLVLQHLKEQVFNKLIEQNEIEVPKALIDAEAQRIHDEIHQHEQHHQHTDDEMKMYEGIAKKRVALSLLLMQYAKDRDIKVDAVRVNARIKEIASSYEQPQEVIEWLSKKEQRQNLESQVIEDQVLEKLIEALPSTDKQMSYAELKGIRI